MSLLFRSVILRIAAILKHSNNRFANFIWNFSSCVLRTSLKAKNHLQRRSYALRRRLSGNVNPCIPSCRVGYSRESWEQAFLVLWEPLAKRFSEGKALVKIDGPQTGGPGTRGSKFEGFAWSFIGAAYYLHGKDNSNVVLPDGTKLDMAVYYREGIINGTNPSHREYWGRIRSRIRLAGNCSIAVGILLTREHIWNKLSGEEQEFVIRWFQEQATETFHQTNWLWFKVFHHLLLEQLGHQEQRENIIDTLEAIESMHAGEGWYSDGLLPHGLFDYYSCWAMQYYSLLFSLLAEYDYPEWSEIFRGRANSFFDGYRHFFAPGGHPPLYGRSQTYRWASISPWGVALALDCIDVDLATLKEALASTVNTFLEDGAVSKDGILSCGYHGEFARMLEDYSSQGSPYWAFKGFSMLLLPEDHPFWKASIKTRRSQAKVSTLVAPKICLLYSEASHVVLFPNSASHLYAMKYDKFAYSNKFLMNYDRSFPVDNSLLVRRKGGRWRARRDILRASCQGGVCDSWWRMGDVEIHSVIVPRQPGYLAIHELVSASPVEFSCGGFPLALSSRQAEHTASGDGVWLTGDGHQVGMRLLYGEADPYIHRRKGMNPDGRNSCVPYFKGRLSIKGDRIAFIVWGTDKAEEIDFPSLAMGDDFCDIKWPDRDLRIELP